MMITMVHEIQSRHFYEKLLTLKYQKYQCPNYDIIYQEILFLVLFASYYLLFLMFALFLRLENIKLRQI